MPLSSTTASHSLSSTPPATPLAPAGLSAPPTSTSISAPSSAAAAAAALTAGGAPPETPARIALISDVERIWRSSQIESIRSSFERTDSGAAARHEQHRLHVAMNVFTCSVFLPAGAA